MSDRVDQAAVLGARLEAGWDEARVEASLARMHARSRRRRVVRVGLGTALVLAVAGAIALRSTPAPSSVAIARRAPEPSVVRLRDGSLARPEQGAVLQVVDDSSERVTLALSGGAARFEVLHDQARLLTVRVGPISIIDLGTVFRVEPQGARVHVAVQEGRVRVEGPGQTAELIAGEARWFSTRPLPPSAPQPAPPVARGQTTAPPIAAPVDRAWKTLAAAGRFDEAWSALANAPPEAVRDEPEELLLAADVARLSAHPGEAIAPLERVVHQHPDDARAPMAAFTLGKVLLAIDRPADAAAAFATARSLVPAGALAEDALAREIEAWVSARAPERAREKGREYLERYPDGAKAVGVRKLVGPSP